MILAARPPETQILTSNQHDLIFFAVVVAGLAMFASFLFSWNSKGEVSSRYRPAVLASMCITAVATLSYTVLLVKVDSGYSLTSGRYVPNPEALFSISPRYMDWTVTVPLLTIELLAVTTLAGRKLSTLRATTVGAAIAMIVTGYLGTQVFDNGGDTFWLWLWWSISMVFFLYLYAALIPAVGASLRALPGEAGRTLSLATAVLLTTFVVYPLVYLIPIFFAGGWWTTGSQVALSAADVVAKVGFGLLVHKVAKLRTAADAEAEDAPSSVEDPIWVNHELRSAPGQRIPQPREGEARAARGAHVSADLRR